MSSSHPVAWSGVRVEAPDFSRRLHPKNHFKCFAAIFGIDGRRSFYVARPASHPAPRLRARPQPLVSTALRLSYLLLRASLVKTFHYSGKITAFVFGIIS